MWARRDVARVVRDSTIEAGGVPLASALEQEHKWRSRALRQQLRDRGCAERDELTGDETAWDMAGRDSSGELGRRFGYAREAVRRRSPIGVFWLLGFLIKDL